MTTITIERAVLLRALEALRPATAPNGAKRDAAFEELRDALSAPATAPEERVKELEAELAATETVITEYRQQCLDNAAEIELLRGELHQHECTKFDAVREQRDFLLTSQALLIESANIGQDAQAAEIARLRKLIADHVNSSNNDDSAGDTFGALMAEVQPKHKPKPFIGTRSAIYKCTDCGHEQSVQEIHTEYGVYVGSGANWCDKCGDGKPERKETP